MVIWVIGLSASGKTTLGREIYKQWKTKRPDTVLVDGDEMRRIFGQDNVTSSYTVEERKRNADRICELCAWLDRQGINVVCCILSLFEESRNWNRATYLKYFEVYIVVPMDVLFQRDVKGLYAKARSGEIKNVVGVDIPFTPPQHPDFVFNNSNNRSDFQDIAREILARIKEY